MMVGSQPLLGARRHRPCRRERVRPAPRRDRVPRRSSRAASARSPVTMTIRATPASRSARIARGVSRRSSSPSSRAPIGRPSTADEDASAPTATSARRSARAAQSGTLRARTDELTAIRPRPAGLDQALRRPSPWLSRLPRATEREPALACRPRRWRPRPRDARPGPARRPAAAPRSALSPAPTLDATQPRAADGQRSGLVEQQVRGRASASSAPPPLTMMPRRAARETPAMKATGRGQDQRARRRRRPAPRAPGSDRPTAPGGAARRPG